ncbi:MAG: hypothetical protein KKF01_02585 [Proteobacteria bacterium]|nr:hypothetical protein [Pseudomonadota bacterium]
MEKAENDKIGGADLRDIAEMARASSMKDVYALVHIDRIEDNLTGASRARMIGPSRQTASRLSAR